MLTHFNLRNQRAMWLTQWNPRAILTKQIHFSKNQLKRLIKQTNNLGKGALILIRYIKSITKYSNTRMKLSQNAYSTHNTQRQQASHGGSLAKCAGRQAICKCCFATFAPPPNCKLSAKVPVLMHRRMHAVLCFNSQFCH